LSPQLIDAIVIAADVEEPDIIEAQMRHVTLKLNRARQLRM
jgi:hypothetical protein